MNIGVILAGGIGSRMGMEIPKQYMLLEGKPVLIYSVEVLDNFPMTDVIVIVAEKQWREQIQKWLEEYGINKTVIFATPGNSRQMSTYNALKVIKKEFKKAETVLVHDAARPFLSEKILSNLYEMINYCDGVLPVLNMRDTMYYSENGKEIDSVPDRTKVYAGQAPELFKFNEYYAAHEKVTEEEINTITGGAVLAFKEGLRVRFIEGHQNNIKITSKEDLVTAKKIINLEKEDR